MAASDGDRRSRLRDLRRHVRHRARCARCSASCLSRALRRGRGGAGARPGAARHRPGRSGRRRSRTRPRPLASEPRGARPGAAASARPRRSATRSCRWCASSPNRAGEAGRYLHWGATTQDIMDTAAVLQIRAGLALIEDGSDGGARPSRRARAQLPRHADGRAHPSAARAADHLRLQGGGVARRSRPPCRPAARAAPARAAGAVRRRRRHPGLARQWRGEPRARAPSWRASWGSASRRSPGMSRATAIAETVQFLALLGGSLGKIAFDVMLMSATEFGEAAEPFVAGPRLDARRCRRSATRSPAS